MSQRTSAQRNPARRQPNGRQQGTGHQRQKSTARRQRRAVARRQRITARRFRRKRAPGLSMDDITIVVPTKNEAANIGRFLQSVPAEAQLIVVDSSHDDTAEIIRRLRPDRTTVISEHANIPIARQLGTELAITPWLLFTDADVELTPNYAQVLASLPVTARTGGIVGTKSTAGGYERYHRLFARGQRLASWLGIPPATGSNMLVSKRALLAVGGFDLDLTVNEDTEAMFRIKRAGWQVRYEPSLEVLGFDHRRLERGTVRKTAHSVARCALLWFRPNSRTVRRSDWGYWKPTS